MVGARHLGMGNDFAPLIDFLWWMCGGCVVDVWWMCGG